ncbi:MAG: thiosulfate oxidation carrier protein SoxY [Gammaproteobacteria bacterium]
MTDSRRAFIKKSFAISGYSILATCGLLASPEANAKLLSNTILPNTLQQTVKRLFKDQEIIASNKIDIQLPKIAVNGAAVPITVTSSLKDVESIAILVEKNPTPLAAKFEFSPDLDPFVSTRLKIAESSAVMVIMETSEGFYSARARVIVTLGGC